jgi:hypothetical protein
MTCVKEHRTKVDYVDFMEKLSLQHPDAKSIRFYEYFLPENAFVLAKKLKFHITPKKESWLNMAEIELSVLSRQCLNWRIGGIETLVKDVATWKLERNKSKATVL